MLICIIKVVASQETLKDKFQVSKLVIGTGSAFDHKIIQHLQKCPGKQVHQQCKLQNTRFAFFYVLSLQAVLYLIITV